jgi:hypothetical protein
MLITEDWLNGIKDDQGLTNGQIALLDIWAKKQNFACFEVIPDFVARFLEKCKGYRGQDLQYLKDLRGF